MNDAITKRISRRNFTTEKISDEIVKKIKNWIDTINEEAGLTIEFVEDGSSAFHSLKKSYGIFSNVRSLLVMKGQKNDKNLQEKVGYYGEDIVLRMTEIGLGTCFVGGTYDDSSFTISEHEVLVCVIVVGNIQKSVKDTIIRTVVSSKNRKSIKDRVIADKDLPDFVVWGLEAVKLAPSALNSQKPTLYYENDVITMRVPGDYKFDLVDLGIAKRHFEIGAGKGRFQFGNGARFILDI